MNKNLTPTESIFYFNNNIFNEKKEFDKVGLHE